MNEIADARQEICATVYIVGSAVTDDVFMALVLGIVGACYMFSVTFGNRNKNEHMEANRHSAARAAYSGQGRVCSRRRV